nr:hypothetical protein [Tanacetum cinerariifolium]
TKEDVHQAVKDKKSPLRFIALPNWFHEAQMATSNKAAKKDDTRTPQKEQQKVNGDKEVPESSQNSNPTASSKVSYNDSFKLASRSTVVSTVSSPVPPDSLSVPSVNERQMQTIEEKIDTSKTLDASPVDIESSKIKSKEQDTSNRSGNDAHDDDEDIRPIYDEEPMAKVNERQMQTIEEKIDTSKTLDASSVDIESSKIESKEQDTSSRSGNDAHDDDEYIRPIYDEEPMAK